MTHVTGYISKLAELKAKGVDTIVVIAFNDPFVQAAWGKANGIKDESIVSFFFPFFFLSLLFSFPSPFPLGHED